MGSLWSFLRKKSNREILGWSGGGLVVLAAGVWAVVTYAFPPSPSKSSAGVEANCGGIAIGGNVTGSNLKAGDATSGDCSRKPK